jgi:hypothetical protein
MSIEDALDLLRQHNEPVPKPLRLPTPNEVAQVEAELSFVFPPQYRKFMLEASNVNYGVREPGLVLPDLMAYISLRHIAESGWSAGVPKDFLPFCMDNGNFFTIGRRGEIGYFDHDDESHRVLGGDFASWILEDWLEVED